MDATRDEVAAADRVVAAVGWRYTLIGGAVLAAPFVYAITLAIVQVELAGREGRHSSPFEMAPLLAGVLVALTLGLAPAVLWADRAARRWLRARPARFLGRLDRLGDRVLRTLVAEEPGCEEAAARAVEYLQLSLALAAGAEAPAIFALVLALTQVFAGAGLWADTFVFAAILVLWLAGIGLAAAVIPTTGRLRAYLRGEACVDRAGDAAPPLAE